MRWMHGLCVAISLSTTAAASAAEPSNPTPRLTLPILFESGAGRTATEPPFTARVPGGAVDLLHDGFQLRNGVRVRFPGASDDVALQGVGLADAKANYFVGRDPRGWRFAVPQYEAVRYTRLYPGIDVLFHATGRSIEYDFELAPGADPSRIALDVRGADRVYVDRGGDLIVQRGGEMLRQRRPVAYQDVGEDRHPVDARYRIAGRRVRIALGPYDRTRRLIIDPTLVYSTFVGTVADDADVLGGTGGTIDVDAAGSVYLAISTEQFSRNPSDLFVAKFAAGTHALVYSAVIGGSDHDTPHGIAVSPDGSVYVTGETFSGDFPFLNAYQSTGEGPFLLRLEPDGTLAFATLFAASGPFYKGAGRAVAAAPDGSAVFAGDTFIARFSPAGTPISSTFLYPGVEALALGPDGSIYVGGTNGPGLPATPGAFQTTPGRLDCHQGHFQVACTDGFVAKLSSDMAQLRYLTYLRETDTSNNDPREQISGIAVNASGEAYVTGWTTSPSFPSTPGAYDTTCGTPSTPCRMGQPTNDIVPYSDVFVTKLNATGTGLVYSTFLGGIDPSAYNMRFEGIQATQAGAAIRVDAAGRATVTGFTTARDFPLVAPIQSVLSGSSDAFVSRLSADGSTLEFSTYLGGGSQFLGYPSPDVEGALSLALGPGGDVWVAGHTVSTDFPVTPDAYQSAAAGGQDAFVMAINMSDPAIVIDTPVDGVTTAPLTVHGWAIDRGSATGAGIDAVHLYAFPNPGSGAPPVFLSATTSIDTARPDVAAIFGPQFMSSGYSLGTCCVGAGTYMLAVYGHSSLTDRFSVVATRTITIRSRPMLALDSPANGATVRSPLLVSGWALDLDAPGRTGIDAIHVWAYPEPGSGAAPMFLGAMSEPGAGFGRPRADVGAIYGQQFTNSGYQMLFRLPPGRYLLAVYGHSTATNQFSVVQTRQVTVEANPMMAVDQPAAGKTGRTFTISGWALDYASTTGTGVDAIHVWAYPDPGSGVPPVFVGTPTYGGPRGDVGAAFGDVRFTASGYSLSVNTLAPGTYDLVVYTHSSVTNTFNNYRVVRITVP